MATKQKTSTVDRSSILLRRRQYHHTSSKRQVSFLSRLGLLRLSGFSTWVAVAGGMCQRCVILYCLGLFYRLSKQLRVGYEKWCPDFTVNALRSFEVVC